jgi:hypothetical protein
LVPRCCKPKPIGASRSTCSVAARSGPTRSRCGSFRTASLRTLTPMTTWACSTAAGRRFDWVTSEHSCDGCKTKDRRPSHAHGRDLTGLVRGSGGFRTCGVQRYCGGVLNKSRPPRWPATRRPSISGCRSSHPCSVSQRRGLFVSPGMCIPGIRNEEWTTQHHSSGQSSPALMTQAPTSRSSMMSDPRLGKYGLLQIPRTRLGGTAGGVAGYLRPDSSCRPRREAAVG